MKLYFVRHGQSQGNLEGKHQNLATPLSDIGIQQAEFVAKRFESLPIDLIISSDYVRCKQTAEIISKKIQSPLIFDPLLREVKSPTQIEGKSISDPEVLEIKKLIQSHIEEKDWHYSDEESYWDLILRAQTFLSTIEGRTEQDIMVVTHGIILRTIVACMMFEGSITAGTIERLKKFFLMTNTGITVCEYQEDKWSLITWNDFAHLG